MKTIIIVRHAQAIDKRFGTPDRDRPLAPAGEKAAKKMARKLAGLGISPDLIVSSPADRALETAHVFAASLKYPVHRILIHSGLYDREGGDCWSEIVPEIHGEGNTLMLVGHNPGLEKLAEFLVRGFALPIPKAGYVRIQFQGARDWRGVQPGSGSVAGYDFPGRKKQELNVTQREVQARIMDGLQEYIHLIGRAALPEVERNAGISSRKIARIIVKKASNRPDALLAIPPARKSR
jgi:phosphohistidine phosphatase